MNQPQSIYDSPRLASGYAFNRPPVHQHIINATQKRFHRGTRFKLALDVGCGAGLSTAALATLAESAVGIEPIRAMLTHSRVVAPYARFLNQSL